MEVAMKPTEEQVKKFWEWCGIYRDLATDGNYRWFKGEEIISPVDGNGDPIIDLNSLFRWAVPTLFQRMDLQSINFSQRPNDECEVILWFYSGLRVSGLGIKEEDALFWANYKDKM